MKERAREEEGKKGEKRGDGEKGENETVSAKRRSVGFISAEAFDIFGQRELWWFFLGGPLGEA